jgi:hypothetical protein
MKQRQNQQAAMNYLHQYRADDELILRDNKPTTPTKQCYNRTSYGLSSTTTSPIIEPDARASVYSYYPPAVVSIDGHTTGHSCSSNHSNKLQPITTDQSSTMSKDDERILRWMTTRATVHAFEAAHIPLPEDNDDDIEVHHNQNSNEVEEPTFIVEGSFYGEYDDDDEGGPEKVATTTNHDIPFESFLRLGESQIMDRHPPSPKQEEEQQQQQPLESNKDDIVCYGHDDDDNDDDDDSVIPSESFMKVGSIMSGSSRCSDDSVDNNEEGTAPLTDAEQSHDKHQQEEEGNSLHATKSDAKETNVPDHTDVNKIKTIAQEEFEKKKFDYLDNTRVISSVTFSSIEAYSLNNQLKDSAISALSDDSLPEQKSSLLAEQQNQRRIQADRREIQAAEVPPNECYEEKDQDSTKSNESLSFHGEPAVSSSTHNQNTAETTTSNIDSTSDPLETNTIETIVSDAQENGDVSPVLPTTTAAVASQPHTRRRKKKKKKKDDGYYPTHSIFVSRHLFSR